MTQLTQDRTKPVDNPYNVPGTFMVLGIVAQIFIMANSVSDGASFWYNFDFVNYWMSSKLIFAGQVMDLFGSQKIYFSHLLAAFGPSYDWHNWSYPPHYLLFTWPWGLFPFHLAMALFLAATFALYAHAVSLLRPRFDRPTLVLMAPFVLCNVLAGQNGFLTAALMLYGLGLRQARPVLAGIAFGLLTIKPQLGILVPILLLFERRWTVIAAAVATTAAAVVLSAVLFGVEAWQGFIHNVLPYQSRVMMHFDGIFNDMMPSTFGAGRTQELTASAALALHGVVAVVAFAVFLYSLFRLRSEAARSLALLLATFLISPYALTYDLGALSAFAAIWARLPAEEMPLPRWRRLVFGLIAFVPLVQPIVSVLMRLHLTPQLLMAGLAIVLVMEGRSRRAAVGHNPVPTTL